MRVRAGRVARGYLLLEVLIAGAIAATMLGTAMFQLQSARAKTVRAEREQVAQLLVVQRLEQARTFGFPRLSPTPVAPFNATNRAGATAETLDAASLGVTGLVGKYTRRTWTTPAPSTCTSAGVGCDDVNGYILPYAQVSVEVQFTVNEQPTTITQTGTTRIYRQ